MYPLAPSFPPSQCNPLPLFPPPPPPQCNPFPFSSLLLDPCGHSGKIYVPPCPLFSPFTVKALVPSFPPSQRNPFPFSSLLPDPSGHSGKIYVPPLPPLFPLHSVTPFPLVHFYLIPVATQVRSMYPPCPLFSPFTVCSDGRVV